MNEKGQVIPASVMMKEIEAQIVEETGLRCCICLEGYKNQSNKVCQECVWGGGGGGGGGGERGGVFVMF